MASKKSRPARWADAVSQAKDAYDQVDTAVVQLGEALRDLAEIQQEYTDWFENMSENLQNSATGEKLSVIMEIDLESIADDPMGMLSDAEEAIGEAEAAELPLGFGRD